MKRMIILSTLTAALRLMLTLAGSASADKIPPPTHRDFSMTRYKLSSLLTVVTLRSGPTSR